MRGTAEIEQNFIDIPKHRDWSYCQRCYISWAIEENPHTTPYRKDGYGNMSSGCFPLCESCWIGLSPEERIQFYRQMWLTWKQQSDPDNFEQLDEDWELIKSAVLNGE